MSGLFKVKPGLRGRLLGASALLAAAPLAWAAPAKAAGCEDLARLRLPHVTLSSISTRDLPPGPFQPAPRLASAPFCRVKGVVRAVRGSRIGFEVWLPQRGWNGRFEMFGNGGYSSALPYGQLAQAVEAGYAVAATDTGHTGDDPEFGRDHPQAIIDWGYRAVHLSAVEAKAVVQAYYGRPARYAYFDGCSTGGHQALMEVQRFPDDFNGVIAGAPGHNRTHLNAGFLWQFIQNHRPGDDAHPIIPAGKLPLITRAVMKQCRAENGGSAGGLASDPFLDRPLSCHFDPGVLQCTGPEQDDCLTAEQVQALRRMYAGATDPRTGERIYYGWPPGSESSLAGRGGWSTYWADPAKPTQPMRANFWRDWVFKNPAWNWWSFDFDKGMKRADDVLAHIINAMDPDLESFRRHGGKLIQYHGEADPVVSFSDSIDYHDRVVADQARRRRLAPEAAARRTADFYRLFLVPGMEHCGGGLGPAPSDLQAAIEAWVEQGQAPERLTGRQAHGGVAGHGYTRPLCVYPRIARYDGAGSPDEAASFKCVAPSSTPNPPPLGRDFRR